MQTQIDSVIHFVYTTVVGAIAYLVHILIKMYTKKTDDKLANLSEQSAKTNTDLTVSVKNLEESLGELRESKDTEIKDLQKQITEIKINEASYKRHNGANNKELYNFVEDLIKQQGDKK